MMLPRKPRVIAVVFAALALGAIGSSASAATVEAPVAANHLRLTHHHWTKVDADVVGRGVVADLPKAEWIKCKPTCGDWWDRGQTVALAALPSPGARFVQWTAGPCSTAKLRALAVCTFKVRTAVKAIAVFENQPVVILSVVREGKGSGTVASSPAGINCGTACAKDVNPGQEITLTAQPGNESAFGGWGGACKGTGITCRATLQASSTVTATFSPLPPAKHTLTITRTGAGTVASNPAGIDCGTNCAQEFATGREVVLNATPGDAFAFGHWEGACTGTQPQCTVNMRQAQTATAVFDPLPVQRKTLVVSRDGVGQGTVVSIRPVSGGISCGSNCTQDYLQGTEVTVQATAAAASTFARWSGACTGVQDTCTMTMSEAQNVTATFVPVPVPTRRLTVVKTGTGSGTVTSVPPDTSITCGSDCSGQYTDGTVVTLRVSPAMRSTFVGWGGACSGGPDQATCAVTLDQARKVTARFDALPPDSFRLSVARDGTGSGGVASSPPGIDCGTDCAAMYVDGTSVTVSATPDNASAFAEWAGACIGRQSTCTVTMDQARQAVATFTLLPPDAKLLTVVRLGEGTGSVASLAPSAGITCGTDCAQSFDQGTEVTLEASATGTSTFTGWGGACTGRQATCTVTMESARDVSAAFAPVPRQARLLVVTKQGAGSGGVTSDAGGINCGLACSAVYQDGFPVTLSATPGDNAHFTGWTGACSGDQPTCTVAMSAERQVGAAFEPLPAGSPYLTVARSGTGPGRVASSPPGIDCGGDCRQGFLAGSQVTLTAMPGEATSFAGWAGVCAGPDPTCVVAIGGDTATTATFTQEVAVLTAGTRAPGTTASIRSSVRVAGPGRIVQRAVSGSGRQAVTWCSTSRAMKAAGSTSLTCNMGVRGRTAIRRTALTLSLRTTFTPTGGPAYATARQVTVKKKP